MHRPATGRRSAEGLGDVHVISRLENALPDRVCALTMHLHSQPQGPVLNGSRRSISFAVGRLLAAVRCAGTTPRRSASCCCPYDALNLSLTPAPCLCYQSGAVPRGPGPHSAAGPVGQTCARLHPSSRSRSHSHSALCDYCLQRWERRRRRWRRRRRRDTLAPAARRRRIPSCAC